MPGPARRRKGDHAHRSTSAERQLGGLPTPGVGWGSGLERIALLWSAAGAVFVATALLLRLREVSETLQALARRRGRTHSV